MSRGEGVFQEIDVLTVIRTVGKRSKVSQAKILQKLETIIPPDEFPEVRALVLDEINNLTRTFVKEIFGDVDYLIR